MVEGVTFPSTVLTLRQHPGSCPFRGLNLWLGPVLAYYWPWS